MAWDIPDTFIFLINGSWNFIQVFFNASPAHFFDLLYHIETDSVPVVDITVRIAQSYDFCPELLYFFNGMYGYAACARDNDDFAVQSLSMPAQHIFQHIDEAVSRCLGTDRGTSERGAFSCQGAAVEPGQPFILSEEKADFPGAGPDIACRDIQIVPDIFEQLRHEALAEGHNFAF